MSGPAIEVQRRHGLSRVQQLAQILRCKQDLGAQPREYYTYELYRPDVNAVARRRFLMQGPWHAMAHVLNTWTGGVDSSKLAQARRLTETGVATPKTLGFTSFAPTDQDRKAPEFIPLSELPRLVPPNGCVLKRERSMWGLGVLVFMSFDGAVFDHADGQRFDRERLAEALREQGGGFLVQERVENHPGFAGLDLPSLATLRVVTYGDSDNIRIGRAALKLPVGRKGVDNYHAGGIAAPVEIASGRVGAGVGPSGLDWISSHPETERRFEGMIVPLWNDVLALVRRAARAMPELRTVGWDVAVTTRGVQIIEGNSEWGTRIVQRPHRSGIWEGEFRDWCIENVKHARLPRWIQRWLAT
jgi:hypothetical protein